MSFPYTRQNADSRRRLEALVSGLSDADLACTTRLRLDGRRAAGAPGLLGPAHVCHSPSLAGTGI